MPMSPKPLYLVVWQYIPFCGNVESEGLWEIAKKKLTDLHCQKKKCESDVSLTKWLCGSMLINGKFFLHDIHSVTLLQLLLQLHGVGNACGCAPWVHSVLILPNFGPMASQKFPSKNAVRFKKVNEV